MGRDRKVEAEEEDVAELARRSCRDHARRMAELADKYVGAAAMALGNSLTDPWSRWHWCIGRIKDLMFQAGRCNQALRRCKPGGPQWEQYDRTERELELLADHLALDLMKAMPASAGGPPPAGGA